MITAKIRFLANRIMADLTCRGSELKHNIEEMGILTPPDLIKLDNARTLQIELIPNDELGEQIYSLVNPKKDTLGTVQKVCRYAYCMNDRKKEIFSSDIQSGKIKNLQDGLAAAQKLYKQKDVQYR